MIKHLTLTRPLILLDEETTGKNPKTARIVQLSYRVFPPDDISYGMTILINPGIPIPKEATEVHGITDEMVKDAPTFRQLLEQFGRASGLMAGDPGPLLPLLSGNADYAGYNVRYDLDVFAEECRRCGFGLSFEGVRLIDGLRLWQVLKPRTLADAVEEFLGRKHEGGHDALVDVNATGDVLEEQIRLLAAKRNVVTFQTELSVEYAPMTVQELHDLQFPRDPSWIDDTGRFVFNEQGDAIINFGKYAGTLLSKVDKGFLRWMLGASFTPQVQLIVRAALEGRYPRRPTDDAR